MSNIAQTILSEQKETINEFARGSNYENYWNRNILDVDQISFCPRRCN